MFSNSSKLNRLNNGSDQIQRQMLPTLQNAKCESDSTQRRFQSQPRKPQRVNSSFQLAQDYPIKSKLLREMSRTKVASKVNSSENIPSPQIEEAGLKNLKSSKYLQAPNRHHEHLMASNLKKNQDPQPLKVDILFEKLENSNNNRTKPQGKPRSSSQASNPQDVPIKFTQASKKEGLGPFKIKSPKINQTGSPTHNIELLKEASPPIKKFKLQKSSESKNPFAIKATSSSVTKDQSDRQEGCPIKVYKQVKKASHQNSKRVYQRAGGDSILSKTDAFTNQFNHLHIPQLVQNKVAPINTPYKYQLLRGNNSKLIQRVLTETRPWWSELTQLNALPHFKWSPATAASDFAQAGITKHKQLVNHFEHHREISKKNELYSNLQTYLVLQGQNVFEYVPITYQVVIQEGKPSNLDLALRKFQSCFDLLEHSKNQIVSINKHSKSSLQLLSFRKIESIVQQKFSHRSAIQKATSTKLVMPTCHFLGANIWILKTTGQNRGMGIHVFSSWKTLMTIMRQYINKANAELSLQGKKSNDGQPFHIPKQLNFVIQKYIERPMLINKRKFDIRVWVLINQDMAVYFFKEGYLRTSCSEYKIDNIQDQYIHLTNNAIQKNSKQYGQFEDGNQLSFSQFQQYIDEHYEGKVKLSVKEDLVPDMKHIVAKTLESIKKKINVDNRKNCFEIYGYDFMVDQEFSVWLIEVNTNPCLEESSHLLKGLIPRMIDDAFKLTIDKEYPNPKQTQRIGQTLLSRSPQAQTNGKTFGKKKRSLIGGKDTQQLRAIGEFSFPAASVYHLEGHLNDSNLWDYVMNLNSFSPLAEASQRVLRTENLIYMPESLDFFVTPLKSYQKYKSDQDQAIASQVEKKFGGYAERQTKKTQLHSEKDAGKEQGKVIEREEGTSIEK